MFLRKYRVLIVIAFLGIFSAKMVISGAPVFFMHIDKEMMNAVIMQIEQHSTDGDSGKNSLKYSDYKLIDFYQVDTYITILNHFGISNSFIDHFKRHVDSYYPSVPTPPPNFC